jgi:TolB-like protein/tetratricopeptide (TPR) repeat protein
LALRTQLRHRRLWRVLIAYPGAVFVVLQVIEFFNNNYDLDHRFMTAAIIAAIILFPAAFFWNWRHGEVGRQALVPTEAGVYVASILFAASAVAWYFHSVPAAAPSPPNQPETVHSVAVMPFENASDDDEVQYLCDGIAEGLINWLSTLPAVKVASKSASFRLREQSDDTAELARVLNVDSVIRGRLEKHGEQIVVSAALVNAEDESQLWGERLVRPVSAIMDLERSIVAAIVQGLSIRVSDNQTKPRITGGTDNPDAYQHYLRGHYLIQSTDDKAIHEGLDELREAIRMDPRFALPYSDIAHSMVQLLEYGWDSGESLLGEARSAAYSAVALAPDLPEAQTALAAVNQTITFNWAEAEKAYDAAIALAPGNATPYDRYADFLWATLRFDRAIAMARKALALDPLDGSALHAVGISLLYKGDFAGAATAFQDWNRFHPGSTWSFIKYGLALALDGRCEAAAQPAATAERLLQDRDSVFTRAWLAWGYQACGREELYAQSIERMEDLLQADPDPTGLGFYQMLEGDLDGLVETMQKIVADRNPLTLYLQLYLLDVFKGPLQGQVATDPRVRTLIRGLDFPPNKWVKVELWGQSKGTE